MLEDVTLHMILPVFNFCFRLLLSDLRRTILGEFLYNTTLDIRILIFIVLSSFSSVLFFLVFLLVISIFHPPCVEV